VFIIRNRIVPFKRFNAINILGVLFARPEAEMDEQLLNHERIHTRQMLEMLIVGFYLWYFIEWLIRLTQKGNAYRNISFEQEAYTHERNPNYLKNRKLYAWTKYLFKRNTHHRPK
jgi:hypothetical protein